MRVAAYLERKKLQDLQQLANKWGVTGAHKVSADQLRQLLAAAFTEAGIDAQLRKLTPMHQLCLNMLSVLFMSYPHGMTVKEAKLRMNNMPEFAGKGPQYFADLIDNGLIFISMFGGWTETIVVPDEVWPKLHRQMAEAAVAEIGQRNQEHGVAAVTVTENRGLSLHHDMMTLLAGIVHEKVEISQQGRVYKRTMNRLLERFRSPEQRFPDTWGISSPRHFLYLELFVCKHKLAKMDQGMVAAVQIEGLEAFLSTPYSEWTHRFHDFYRGRLTSDRDPLPLSILNSIFFRLAHTEWVSFDSVQEEIASLMKRWNLPLSGDRLHKYMYDPFIVLGLIETGKDERGSSLWRWTDWGKVFVQQSMLHVSGDKRAVGDLMTDHIYVQPNLEILVPENIVPAVRWKVEALAELKRADSVLIYELSCPRILQALDSGWTHGQIRDFLERHSKNPVAPNVIQTIEDWGRTFGRAELWDVMVLKIVDEQTAEWLGREKKLAPFLVGALSGQAFVIRRSDEKEVRALMAEFGLSLPLRIVSPDGSRRGIAARSGSPKRVDADHFETIRLNNLSALAPELAASALKIATVGSLTLESATKKELEETDDDFDDFDDDDDSEVDYHLF